MMESVIRERRLMLLAYTLFVLLLLIILWTNDWIFPDLLPSPFIGFG